MTDSAWQSRFQDALVHTPRLALEPITEAHAARLLASISDELLYTYLPHWLPTDLEELQRRFAIYATGRSRDGSLRQLNWAVRRRADDVYVGMIQVTFDDQAQIGYSIFVPYWRLGYAKEAVTGALDCLKQRYAAHAVAAFVDVENIASIALLESLGFTRLGAFPSSVLEGHTEYRYERAL